MSSGRESGERFERRFHRDAGEGTQIPQKLGTKGTPSRFPQKTLASGKQKRREHDRERQRDRERQSTPSAEDFKHLNDSPITQIARSKEKSERLPSDVEAKEDFTTGIEIDPDRTVRDVSSSKGKGSTIAASPPFSNPSVINHEDEIERIKAMRARRLRNERQERDGTTPDANSKRTTTVRSQLPVEFRSSSAVEAIRERRRERDTQRDSNSAKSNSKRGTSSHLVTRRELEDAGLVRKDSRRKSELSLADQARAARSRRELSPRRDLNRNRKEDGSVYSSRSSKVDMEDDDVARGSRLKRDWSDRSTVEEDGTYTLSRSRRDSTSRKEEDESAYTKARRRREMEREKGRQKLGKHNVHDENDVAVGLREHREAQVVETHNSTDDLDVQEQSTLRRNDDVNETIRDKGPSKKNFRRQSKDAPSRKQTTKVAAIQHDTDKKTQPMPDGHNGEIPSFLDGTQTSHPKFAKSDEVSSLSITIVSAVDLPQNIVPNMPLCPVLKVGIVRLPIGEQEISEFDRQDIEENSTVKPQSWSWRSTTSKIMSKRDNGSLDFHQEFRWDNVEQPNRLALRLELLARSVRQPTNFEESPFLSNQLRSFMMPKYMSDAINPTMPNVESLVDATNSSPISDQSGAERSAPNRQENRSASGSEEDMSGGFRVLWRKAANKKAAELEAAEAAAAVARLLVDQDNEDKQFNQNTDVGNDLDTKSAKFSIVPQTDFDVALRSTPRTEQKRDLTEDVRLGTLLIPLAKLSLERTDYGRVAQIEKWYQLRPDIEALAMLNGRKKSSLLLKIVLSPPNFLDKRESQLGTAIENRKEGISGPVVHPTREENLGVNSEEEEVSLDPVLEPGVVDFIAVVGCRGIGNQKNDNGMKGWVDTSPECVVLEQYPPNNEFHHRHGRNSILPEMVQWFCFPEGIRLWRGTCPPSHADLNLKRFSASSPPNVASAIAAFDACLSCTTSFSWFVIASNSDKYGSQLVKTYGAVIRFFVPAPLGIDPTQEDFAQTVLGNTKSSSGRGAVKRLWVPIGICLTSSLPIIGVMEAMLLRLCEELVSKTGSEIGKLGNYDDIHQALSDLIVNYQKPIAGAVNCSIPFLSGDRFLLSLPPPTGLPSLPHGKAIVSVCRLLGAEGLNYILAAILTECKILIHSQDIADIAMVADVVTALIYPFVWSLPYIPILPVGMLEIVEAPLSYLLGIPSCNLKLLNPDVLEDVVVIDLDNGFSSSEYLDGRRTNRSKSKKNPIPLPSPVAASVSRAVYRLLRAEYEVDEEYGASNMGDLSIPRLETESLAEREFRVAIAIEVCGLLRGYQECLGPVFNRDKFLKTSPALFEDRRDRGVAIRNRAPGRGKVISPRSKRFLSLLLNTQNFQQFLETLDKEETSFFHEVMDTFNETASEKSSRSTDSTATRNDKLLTTLVKSLQKMEDRVPTYRIRIDGESDDQFDDDVDDAFFFDEDECRMLTGHFDDMQLEAGLLSSDDPNIINSFTRFLLSPIDKEVNDQQFENGKGVSMEYLTRLEKAPWEYQRLLALIQNDGEGASHISSPKEKVKLKEAIGERYYRAWKTAHDKKETAELDVSFAQINLRASKQGAALDLTSLVSSASTSGTSDNFPVSGNENALRRTTLAPEQQKIANAKDRDLIRRCLDRAQKRSKEKGEEVFIQFLENGRDLMAESEKALANPSAQRFLLSILAQRSRLENQRVRTDRRPSTTPQGSVSRLSQVSFECLFRLGCAMLDACMEFKEYEPAYRLLTHTAGFITFDEQGESTCDETETHEQIVNMTSRIGLHPIFADLDMWKTVMEIHLHGRRSERKQDFRSTDEEEEEEEQEDEIDYEAATATLYEMVGYGIPGEELSRFAHRVSEERGWFGDERGRQLLVLARRLTVRRDQTEMSTSTLEYTGVDACVSREGDYLRDCNTGNESHIADETKWTEFGWCHPAAAPGRTAFQITQSNAESYLNDEIMKRSPVTALTSFGSGVVVTGGLDGGVFVVNAMNAIKEEKNKPEIRGIHLDWGSASRAGTGLSSDGEYGVGAVSCLAAASATGYHSPSSTKDSGGLSTLEDFLNVTDGNRVIAGTTAGDLRVWSIKDIYSSLFAVREGEDSELKSAGIKGSAITRLKFSLRGRALSGHRGGVTCIDVPAQVYRPDALVTGGADGLIKLWSLRAPTTGRRQTTVQSTSVGKENQQQRGRGGDALSILNGHSGRILCVKTAWHGDQLLSGGADGTVRVWDLAAGGTSLHTLSSHSGWVTQIQYWGPNTIVSGSTDRSLAIWDTRVRSSPLFLLRFHCSPISDLLVGMRTDPLMVSAAADGSIATWDFRALSSSSSKQNAQILEKEGFRVVRQPKIIMPKNGGMEKYTTPGHVFLSRNVVDPLKSIYSVGSDAVIQEWDIRSGHLRSEVESGHHDSISSLRQLSIGRVNSSTGSSGLLSTSWDGTIRLRQYRG